MPNFELSSDKDLTEASARLRKMQQQAKDKNKNIDEMEIPSAENIKEEVEEIRKRQKLKAEELKERRANKERKKALEQVQIAEAKRMLKQAGEDVTQKTKPITENLPGQKHPVMININKEIINQKKEKALKKQTKILRNKLIKKIMQKLSSIVFTIVCFVAMPFLSCVAITQTVGSIIVSIDNVRISNNDIEGKIDFLPVISSKDVNLQLGLGASWDGATYNIQVNNSINGHSGTISGRAPYFTDGSDWFADYAEPAEYTLYHDRDFTGQSVTFEFNGTNNPQDILIRVYEDSYRSSSSSSLNNQFNGYIMLNVDDAGKAYYISPISKKAYYLAIPKISFQIMRGSGVGISNDDLKKIPVADGCPDYMPDCDDSSKHDSNFTNQQKGKIFLQVQENGEAWYVYPSDSKRYFLGTPENAYEIMKDLGWGINNADFEKLELAY